MGSRVGAGDTWTTIASGQAIDLYDHATAGTMVFNFYVGSTNLWTGSSTSSEGVNTGSITQNMNGGLSFVVDAGSDASETYITQLDGVQKATISPSGVGPWFLNYTFAEHTAIGYGTWSLIDQSGAIATPLTTTNTSGPPASTTNSRRKVFCNFW